MRIRFMPSGENTRDRAGTTGLPGDSDIRLIAAQAQAGGKKYEDLDSSLRARIVEATDGKGLQYLPVPLQRTILAHLKQTAGSGDTLETNILWACALSLEHGRPELHARVMDNLSELLTPFAKEISNDYSQVIVRDSDKDEETGIRDEKKEHGKHEAETFCVPSRIFTSKGVYEVATATTDPELIGKGGCGAVFLARTSDGRDAAMKVVCEDSRYLTQFFLECLTMLRFTGLEDTIQLYDAGKYVLEDEGSRKTFYFLVQEYGETTLAREIERRQKEAGKRKELFSAEEKRSIIYQLLEILCTLHGHRIIHRDIKPENLFLVNGALKIGDFGIAQYLPFGEETVVSRKFEGTPRVSPDASTRGIYNFYTDLFGFARTVACLEPGLFREELGNTTIEGVQRGTVEKTTVAIVAGSSLSRIVLNRTRRLMRTDLAGVLHKLEKSEEPFIRYVVTPLLEKQKYPGCPSVCEELLGLADAVSEMDRAAGLIEKGEHAAARRALLDVRESCADEPWFAIVRGGIERLLSGCRGD